MRFEYRRTRFEYKQTTFKVGQTKFRNRQTEFKTGQTKFRHNNKIKHSKALLSASELLTAWSLKHFDMEWDKINQLWGWITFEDRKDRMRRQIQRQKVHAMASAMVNAMAMVMDRWAWDLKFRCNLKFCALFIPQLRMGLRKSKNFMPRILTHSAHTNTDHAKVIQLLRCDARQQVLWSQNNFITQELIFTKLFFTWFLTLSRRSRGENLSKLSISYFKGPWEVFKSVLLSCQYRLQLDTKSISVFN